MKRVVLLFSLLSVPLLASCAYPAAHNTVRPVTGYIRPVDDWRTDCVGPEQLLAAAVNDSVWARCEWWQSGALLKADSTRSPRAVYLTFLPPPEVPNSTKVTSSVWLRDVGGTSCAASYNQMPSQTLVKPSAFSGLSVVP